MTKCPYCFTVGAYDSGVRVECLNPSCEHFSKRWAEENGYGGRTEEPAAAKEPRALDMVSKYPASMVPSGDLLVPEESLPPPGSGRRILTTPPTTIHAGCTANLVARPQLPIRVDEVLIVSPDPEAVLYLIDFRIGCDSQFAASHAPIERSDLDETPLLVDRPAHCAVDLSFHVTNASLHQVVVQGVCRFRTEDDMEPFCTYTDTELEFEKHKIVAEERERIARMFERLGRRGVDRHLFEAYAGRIRRGEDNLD